MIMRRLWICAVAAFALSALANASPAAASPPGFLAGAGGEYAYPATLESEATGSASESRLHLGGLHMNCTPYPSSDVQASPSSTLTISGGAKCSGPNGTASTYLNGCSWTLHPTSEQWEYLSSGTVSIGPPGCGPIELKDLISQYCTISLDPESAFSGTAGFHNEGGTVDVNVELAGIQWTGSGGGCAENEGSADWTQHLSVGSVDELEEPTSLELVPALPGGVYLTGEEAEEESEQPRFEAEYSPQALVGGGFELFQTSAGKFFCKQGAMWGDLAAGAEVALNYEPGECRATALEFPMTVEVNSCHYVLHLLNAGPPYEGSFGVACDEEGDAIEYSAFSKGSLLCRASVGAQQGIEGISLSNSGEGFNRKIGAEAAVEGIEYEYTGGSLCTEEEVRSDGEISGETTLTGVSAPPETGIEEGPEGTVDTPDVSFSFAGTGKDVTFQCSLDQATFSACTSPKSYEGLAEGEHSFRVRAVDVYASENWDKTPAERDFTVAPNTSIDSYAPTYLAHEIPDIDFSASIPGATFKCSLDDAKEEATEACTSPYSLPKAKELSQGWHTFVVQATGKEGLEDPTPESWSLTRTHTRRHPRTTSFSRRRRDRSRPRISR